MNYSYNNDSFNSVKLSELLHLNVSDTTTIVNGTMKNVTDQDSTGLEALNDLDQEVQYKPNVYGTLNDCYEIGFNNKKLKFSEKLKVLLKNGGNKSEKGDLNDPYAFSEIDSQYSVSCDEALNNVDSLVQNSALPDLKSNNVSLQKSIIFPKSVVPKLLVNNAGIKKCQSETKNSYKNMKLAKIAVPLYTQNNSLVTNVNQTSYKLSGTSSVEKFKNANSRNAKAIASHLSPNNKHFIGKSAGKPSSQSVKSPSNVNNPFKVNKNGTAKPQTFGQSQLFRHSSLKADRKAESKSKSFAKGKSLLNQIQKTVALNRSIGKPRKIPSKPPPCQTSGKSSSAESELPLLTNANNRNISKRSLLEESLLGIKNNSNKDPMNFSLKQRTTLTNNVKYNHSHLPIETGRATVVIPPKLEAESLGLRKQKSLQRIWSVRNKLNLLKRDHHHFGLTVNDVGYEDDSTSESLLFQNYWFSVSHDNDQLSYHDRKRDTKLSQLKIELRHKIKQLQWKYRDEYRDKVVELLVESARRQPNLTAFLITLENSQFSSRKKFSRSNGSTLIRSMLCSFENPETGLQCEEEAMPCVKYCRQHITRSDDQLLFTPCTAIRNDNTACLAPVLDLNTENPLCLQHKRLEFMSEKPKKILNAKTKPMNKMTQPRKRSRSSTSGSNRTTRNRKRKRVYHKDRKEEAEEGYVISSNADALQKLRLDKNNEESNDLIRRRNALIEINPQVVTKSDVDESQEVEVGEEVLAMAADLPLELANHATRLLEEHDFTNVLNHIPADAFNDLFTEDKEEYEPTPQETEELERALEAVDNDVKSLEKLSQTQGILDALLDEQTIAQTLAQLPEVTANLEVPPTLVPVFYQNGFTNLNQIEQTLHDVNKSLTQTVLLNQGTDVLNNHFTNNLAVPNHADMLQS